MYYIINIIIDQKIVLKFINCHNDCFKITVSFIILFIKNKYPGLISCFESQWTLIQMTIILQQFI